MDKEPIKEILLKDATEVKLARVLLIYDMGIWKYPQNGVWSYLINTPTGITVFDTGPYFKTLLGGKGQLTHNADKILLAIEEIFGNKPINQILLSHYHHDHSQNAPALQKANLQKHGIIAPIGIHINDLGEKRLLNIFKTSLKGIFTKAGFSNVLLRNPLSDNEQIEGTDFRVISLPGHTHGSIGLINDKEKIIISGWWKTKSPNLLTTVSMALLNEDKKHLKTTQHKLNNIEYKFYYLHKLKE